MSLSVKERLAGRCHLREQLGRLVRMVHGMPALRAEEIKILLIAAKLSDGV